MGLIRLLLALAVVSEHTNSHRFLKLVGGEVAVQAFFMMSGFYMALVISTYQTKKKFWISRYLRLYPTYFCCALFVLLFGRGLIPFAERIARLPAEAAMLLSFTNLTMFFQDTVMFLGVNSESLSFVKHFSESSPPLHKLLLIPQAWSLGVELSFYACVPFLLTRSTRTICGWLLLSLMLRLCLIAYGPSGDPWSYRFFPTELATFLGGALIHRWSRSIELKALKKTIARVAFCATLLFLISFGYVPLDYPVKKILFMLVLASSLGQVFALTQTSKLDRFIGRLAYPVYVSHLIVLEMLIPRLGYPAKDGQLSSTLLAYSFVTIFATLLYVFVEQPVERFRRRFKERPADPDLRSAEVKSTANAV